MPIDRAHRPFPSMMMATCRPFMPSPARPAPGSGYLPFAAGTSPAPGAPWASGDFRFPVLKTLGDLDVTGFFQPPCVDTQIAVARLQDVFQFRERETLVRGERGNDPQADTLVDQAVEFFLDRAIHRVFRPGRSRTGCATPQSRPRESPWSAGDRGSTAPIHPARSAPNPSTAPPAMKTFRPPLRRRRTGQAMCQA